MSDRSPRRGARLAGGLSIVLLATLTSACSEGQHRLVLEYPSELDYSRGRLVRVFIAASTPCNDLDRDGLEPQLQFDPHGEVPPLGQINTGPVAFFTEVQDVSCNVYLEGCTQATIIENEDAIVRIFLQPTERAGCPASAGCHEGLCRPIDASAVLDAAIDATLPDASRPDARLADTALRDQQPGDAGPTDTRADDSAHPDTSATDSSRPDLTQLDAAQLDQWRPDQWQRDQWQPDRWQPDQWQPDQWRPDQWRPDTTQPDQWQPDTNRPDQWQPDQWQPDAADPSWLLQGWSERLYMRLHNAYSIDDLVDFPVLVRLDPSRFDYDAARSDGADLRFTDADGNVHPHEVEKWNPGGESAVWVGVPLIPAATNDTELWLYYGNDDAADIQDPAGVWANGHLAVLHLEGGSVADSSGQGNDSALTGTTAVGGAAAGARLLSEGDRIDIASLNNASFPQTAGAVSVWVYGDLTGQTTSDNIFDGSDTSRNHFFVRPTSADALQVVAQAGSTNKVNRTLGLDDSDDNRWMHIAFSFDTAAGDMAVFLDGWRSGPYGLTSFAPSGQRARFGSGFVGRIDEIRVSSVFRNLDWIRASYDTMVGRFLLYEPPAERPDADPRSGPRVEGAVVVYEFDEGSGSVVHDRSGVAPALDLTIAHPDRVTWVGDGIDIVGSTIISSAGPATKVIDACSSSGEITIEAWLLPDSPYLSGPARIVTLSLDPSFRNFTLGQGSQYLGEYQGYYLLRYRTDLTGDNGSGHTVLGTSPPATPDGTVYMNQPSHLVFVREDGAVSAYIDGVEVLADEPWTGATTPDIWDDTMRLALANEFAYETDNELRRPWVGTLYLVAIYCRALSALEVDQNYAAGL